MTEQELKDQVKRLARDLARMTREKEAYQKEWHAEILTRRLRENHIRAYIERIDSLLARGGHITADDVVALGEPIRAAEMEIKVEEDTV